MVTKYHLHNATDDSYNWFFFRFKKQTIFVFLQIVSCILLTIDLIFLNGKARYYPLKDIVGSSLCYFHVYAWLWFGMYIQFSSLFITFYRCICMFFGQELIRLKISPKVMCNPIKTKKKIISQIFRYLSTIC